MEEKKTYSDVNVKAEQELKEYMTRQYNCGHSCRICPYPGAKCRENDSVARRIQ